VAVNMIDINLLPEELRPRPRNPLPYLTTIALAAAVVLYCLISFAGNWRTISVFHNDIARLDEQIDAVRESAEAVKKLEIENRSLSNKQVAISTIMSDRIVWSKVLNNLAQLVPDDVWLSDLKEDVKSISVQVDNPDPEAAQKTITKNVIIRKLEISGYALSPREEEGVNHVGRFVRVMEDENDPNYIPEFAALFRNPTPQSVNDESFQNTAVKKFEIWCDIVQKGAQ